MIIYNVNEQTKIGLWKKKITFYNEAVNKIIIKNGNMYRYELRSGRINKGFKICNDNDEMWKINKEFLKRQKEIGCDFYFSHNPFDPKVNNGFTAREIEYLTLSINEGDLGGKILPKPVAPNLWKVEF